MKNIAHGESVQDDSKYKSYRISWIKMQVIFLFSNESFLRIKKNVCLKETLHNEVLDVSLWAQHVLRW